MTYALEGVRVVDFGHYIAGPLAALLLAEAGADVVHVDTPEASGSPGPLDAWLNRSKRRITLDLKSDADRSNARALAQRADVVIENFRPGVMERLGLGTEQLRGDNDRLIFCSLPGFASEDENASLKAWEGIVHAAVAGYRPLEQHWDPSGRNRAKVSDPSAPMFTPITTASNFGGLMGAVSIVMALIARERNGLGQRIEIPLAEAFAEAYSTMLGYRVYENSLMGDNQMLRDLTYECQDGGKIDLSPYSKFVIPLLVEAGFAEEWERQGLIDITSKTFELEHRELILDKFAAVVRTKPAQWWDDVATRAQTPLSMVRTPEQWLATPQAVESGAVVALDDPLSGAVVLPGRGFDMTGDLPRLSPRHLPDQDRAALLEELGGTPYSVVDRTRATESVALPLEGYTAIDISQAVAGPTAARVLSDFGADVIKVGNPVPAVTDGIVGQLHRGKRAILMDIRSSEGSRLLGQLLRKADVFMTNFTPQAQDKYGIDYETTRAINPELVYCSLTAYGQSGPWVRRRGYENQCNAATGMSWRYGSRFGWTLYQPTPINDADTGILGAYATAVALYARMHGASGQKVASSLAQGSTFHQGAYFAAEAQASDEGPDASRNEYGMNAVYRFYRASDDWFFLAARDQDLAALVTAVNDPVVSEAAPTWQDPGGDLARALVEAFAGKSAKDWVTVLDQAGIAVQVARSIDEAISYLVGRGLVYFEPGVNGQPVARPGVGNWLSETPPRVGVNPGPVGSQVKEILEDLGVSDEEMEALAKAGVLLKADDLPKLEMLA